MLELQGSSLCLQDVQGLECLDAQDVKRAVSQAIQNWSTQVNEQQ